MTPEKKAVLDRRIAEEGAPTIAQIRSQVRKRRNPDVLRKNQNDQGSTRYIADERSIVYTAPQKPETYGPIDI